MYHPTTRVLTVLELLQTYGQIPSDELARRLEVTPRSVRRYITMLQELGIPVESQRGRHGGYRLRPGYKLPPLMFTNNEALAVTLGLLHVDRLGLTASEPAIEGALAKIGRVLPDSVQAQIQSVQESTLVDDAQSETRTPTDTVIAFSQAVQNNRRIWIRYKSPWDETTRTVDLYGLVLREGIWYAVGWCQLREAVRVFRLDRIVKYRVLSSTFIPPPGFNARKTAQQLLEQRFEYTEVELLLKTSMNEARHLVSIISASLEETAYGIVFKCNPGSLTWLATFTATMPWPVTVLKPPELMDELQRLSERIATIRYEPANSSKEVVPDLG